MKEKKKIGRREFLKVAGTGAAVTTAALYGCKPRSAGSASEADGARQGQMTYRTNPKTGDRVSLLGYGCMRWPTVSGSDDIDQEMVNALVDHAIAHGVNYFDTSPAYCRGHSEHATGVALSRHPRDKYFIATKLSNFAPSTWSREASMAMYRNSFRELQVDYIDYLLLHGVGMGSGMEEFEARYIDNGMLDFLLAEREAGRIRNLGFSYHGDIAVFDHLLAQHDRYKWDFVQIQLNYVDWKHAKEVNTRNTDAEYLYGGTGKARYPGRHHGAAAGRAPFECPRPHRRPSQTAAPVVERRFVGVPFRGVVPRGADRAERHDLHGAFAGQPAYLLAARRADR